MDATTGKIEFRKNNFDLLRLLAATQVIVDHYFQHLNIPISNFSTKLLYLFPGVPVFFVISGYLISASYERNSKLTTYVRNRALRIFPGLWTCIFVTILVFTVTGVSFSNKEVVAWLPAQLTGFIYTPKFLSNYGFGSYNGSLWTIPLELQFYILLPFCYLITPKKRTYYWLLPLLALFIGLNLVSSNLNFSPQVNKLLSYTFIPNFYLFLTGFILQRSNIFRSAAIYNKAPYWVIAYITFSLLLQDHMNFPAFLVLKNLLLSVCIISMAYSAPGLAKKLLKDNDISYGIYIYHGLILTVIVQEKWASSINLFEVILFAYAFGYLSWIGIEKRFLRRKEKKLII